jgi:DNA topoisomerase-1
MSTVAAHAAAVETARSARLRYVTDRLPGIRRLADGDTFLYIGPDGSPVCNPREEERIRSLGIPPAWSEVWICPLANGHLQATGRDAKGRKQYRYHARWREVRDSTKFDRMVAFAEALPEIRRRVDRDLARPGMPREKVLATVVRLLETTSIRVGNEEYARENRSYGLTTLRNRHAKVAGATVQFHFVGKSGKRHAIDLRDRRLARIVAACKDLPGQRLFEYLEEEGRPQTIDSADVNAYLHEITGQEFTSKDFRTWIGTVLAMLALRACGPCSSERMGKAAVVRAIDAVREQLGNTRAVCRKYYVHPAVLESYLDGTLSEISLDAQTAASAEQLRSEEAAVLSVLKQRAIPAGT